MANSLGTLTLDLVAKIGGFTGPLDKAARESQKRMADIKKSAEVAGVAIGAMTVATAAGLAALTVNTVRTANEITRLSAVSGASAEEFQRYAAGAKAVGIEQDKLADIFKDTNDKVGDFLQTGGGALADFFENVGPKVGVTADQFRELSGPQALGLYVSSLEKAGASQQDMTFYLEAIASDATALLPLLKNNAEGFKLLGDEAARAGAILDDKTIRAATELQAVSILTDQAMDGLRNQIAAGLLPVLADLSGVLFTVSGGTDIAAEAGQTFGNILKGMAATAFGAYAAFQAVGKSIAALASGFAAAGVEASDLLLGPLSAPVIGAKVAKNFDAFKGALDAGFEDVGQSVEGYAKVLDGIWSAGSGEGAETDFSKRIKLIADLLEQAKKSGTSAGIVIDQNAEKNQKAAAAIQSQVEALQLQAATLGLSTKEETLFKLALDGATASQLKQAEAALDAVAAFESQTEAIKKAAEEQKRINEEAVGIADSLASEEEQVQKSYERRRQIILDNTEITGNAQTELLRKLEEQRAEQLLEINGSYWERWLEAAEGSLTNFDELAASVVENFSSQVGSAFESMVFDAETLDEAVSNLAEGMARSVINALGQMAAQWLAYQVVQTLVGKTAQSSAATAMIANAEATSAQASLAAFASTAAIPIVGPAAAPAAAAAAAAATLPMVAAVSAFALAGMAHDGIDSIPQTGTWLLEKGERVTTAETSAKLDNTLAQVQAGMASGGRGGRGGNTIHISLPGVTNAREARESSTSIQRAVARGVAGSGRYA